MYNSLAYMWYEGGIDNTRPGGPRPQIMNAVYHCGCFIIRPVYVFCFYCYATKHVDSVLRPVCLWLCAMGAFHFAVLAPATVPSHGMTRLADGRHAPD
jgi:hypothetical protein